jgi:transposase InsO family protein
VSAFIEEHRERFRVGPHERNYLAYGSRRMWKTLLRPGEQVGRGRVERLMRQNAMQGAKRRGKRCRTTRADPLARRSPDLVQRDFTASRPDELWFADFTYLRCWEEPGVLQLRHRRLQPHDRRLARRGDC